MQCPQPGAIAFPGSTTISKQSASHHARADRFCQAGRSFDRRMSRPATGPVGWLSSRSVRQRRREARTRDEHARHSREKNRSSLMPGGEGDGSHALCAALAINARPAIRAMRPVQAANAPAALASRCFPDAQPGGCPTLRTSIVMRPKIEGERAVRCARMGGTRGGVDPEGAIFTDP